MPPYYREPKSTGLKWAVAGLMLQIPGLVFSTSLFSIAATMICLASVTLSTRYYLKARLEFYKRVNIVRVTELLTHASPLVDTVSGLDMLITRARIWGTSSFITEEEVAAILSELDFINETSHKSVI